MSQPLSRYHDSGAAGGSVNQKVSPLELHKRRVVVVDDTTNPNIRSVQTHILEIIFHYNCRQSSRLRLLHNNVDLSSKTEAWEGRVARVSLAEKSS